MQKASLKERAIDLMQDGERRSVGEIGTLLGVYKHSIIENFLLNNQNVFEYEGNGWRLIPPRQRSKVDPIMQGEFPAA